MSHSYTEKMKKLYAEHVALTEWCNKSAVEWDAVNQRYQRPIHKPVSFDQFCEDQAQLEFDRYYNM